MNIAPPTVAPHNLRELAAAVIRRALLDLVSNGTCTECKLPLKECAKRFLSGEDGELAQWTNLTSVVKERELKAKVA